MTPSSDSPPPPEGRVTVEADGHVLLIGLDRPAKLNGITPEMLTQLAAAYTRLERERDLRAGVLFAHGRNFTAGIELPRFAALMRAGEARFDPALVDPLGVRGAARTKPLVVGVRGICFTIGIELMLAGDIVVAGHDSRFAQIEVKRGIMPTGGATFRMVERAGWGNAQRWLLTGDEFGADEARRIGFVQEIVPPDQVLARCRELAATIARQAPLAVQASLASSRRFVEEGPAAAIGEFVQVQSRLARSEDAAEGVRSFVERREGRFQGG
ncbi:MAG: crotonase/enoyl-CoA hydratase family protein [Alphaproteobacteria bacterium]|nr:crotonase/enoyl-CoA hydratase family protein [Alphaproteobacteria bacterium]